MVFGGDKAKVWAGQGNGSLVVTQQDKTGFQGWFM
jgi:hypothetical protein